MTKALKKLARARLRRNLDEPTRAELYFAIYMLLDRAQVCAAPLARLREARAHIDALIASYGEVRR